MGYQIRKLDFEEAQIRSGQYPYMLVHMMSEVLFGKSAPESVCWEEMLDARFFSEGEELHIFRCEGVWKAVIVMDDDEREDLTLTYPVAGRFRDAGRELTVRQYLTADEDGQLYVELTRLCGIV